MTELQPGMKLPDTPPWRPSLVIGTSLGTNISTLERARRNWVQWEHIHKHTLAVQGETAAGYIEQLVAKAKTEWEELNRDAQTGAE